jgi:hypothetical protein
MNMPLALLNRRRRGAVAFSPAALFAASEPGVWYDPSDLTTLFQDTVGTTPVTTPGQPVGLALDKSKGLVLGSELVTNGDFSSGTGWTLAASWSVSGGTANYNNAGAAQSISQNITLAAGSSYIVTYTVSSFTSGFVYPRLVGASTVNGTSATAAGTYRQFIVAPSSPTTFGFVAQGVMSIDNISVKELPGFHATQATAGSRPIYGIVPVGGARNILRQTETLATQTRTVTAAQHTLSFRGTGTVTLTGTSTAGPLVGTGISNIVSLTFTPTAGSLTLTVSGTVNDAQLELGSARSGYQLVSDAGGYNVTEAGVSSLSYLAFDGVDDFLLTPTITPGIDKAQVFAGVRKLSDAATGAVFELTTNSNSVSGGLGLFAPFGASANYGVRSRGTTTSAITVTGTAPETVMLTSICDIAGDVTSLGRNGATRASSSSDQGSGNYATSIAYIGRKAGTSEPFNGQIFSLIVRFGANLTADQITSTETWVNGKTRAY